MATKAQFKEGQVVWYTNSDLSQQLAVITKVTDEDPAQYNVAMTADSSKVTCGEGENEPGAVSALS